MANNLKLKETGCLGVQCEEYYSLERGGQGGLGGPQQGSASQMVRQGVMPVGQTQGKMRIWYGCQRNCPYITASPGPRESIANLNIVGIVIRRSRGFLGSRDLKADRLVGWQL